jgi:site-specific recombinase XerD
MMLEELQRRNYAQNTAKTYIRIVRDFAKHYHTAPDLLGPDQIREYSAYLFQDCKLDAGTVEQHVAGLRFFYIKTLKRHVMVDSLPFPKRRRKLPEILSPEEMAKLIDSASNLFHRAILMTLYSTALAVDVTDLQPAQLRATHPGSSTPSRHSAGQSICYSIWPVIPIASLFPITASSTSPTAESRSGGRTMRTAASSGE